jgi:hypothetical protein
MKTIKKLFIFYASINNNNFEKQLSKEALFFTAPGSPEHRRRYELRCDSRRR